MRALRSALSAAGALRSKYANLAEESVVLRALYDVTKAKLLTRDQIPFDLITRDLFDGVPLLTLDEEVSLKKSSDGQNRSILGSSHDDRRSVEVESSRFIW